MKLALIIGHSSKSQGAKLYTGQTEWSYHQDMVNKYLYRRLPLVTDAFEIFWRRSDLSYRDAIADLADEVGIFGATFAIDLHVNAFDGKTTVLGHEFMYNHEESYNFGLRYSDALTALGIHRRRSVLAQEGIRGAYNLLSLPCPGILVEPCFGDTENEDSVEIVGKPWQYAEVLAQTLWEWQNG